MPSRASDPKDSKICAEAEKIIGSHEWHSLRGVRGGTGAQGVLLQRLLGLDETNNQKLPDAKGGVGIEVKSHSKDGLVTLLHLTPIGGSETVTAMMETYGIDSVEKLSFRYTIRNGRSERFKLEIRDGLLHCDPCPSYKKGPSACWKTKEIERESIRKLSHLLLFRTSKRTDSSGDPEVRYDSCMYCTDMISGADFVQAIMDGVIAVDFDISLTKHDNYKHDHGSKLRLSFKDFPRVWERITPIGDFNKASRKRAPKKNLNLVSAAEIKVLQPAQPAQKKLVQGDLFREP